MKPRWRDLFAPLVVLITASGLQGVGGRVRGRRDKYYYPSPNAYTLEQASAGRIKDSIHDYNQDTEGDDALVEQHQDTGVIGQTPGQSQVSGINERTSASPTEPEQSDDEDQHSDSDVGWNWVDDDRIFPWLETNSQGTVTTNADVGPTEAPAIPNTAGTQHQRWEGRPVNQETQEAWDFETRPQLSMTEEEIAEIVASSEIVESCLFYERCTLFKMAAFLTRVDRRRVEREKERRLWGTEAELQDVCLGQEWYG